eukprot:TRINITY_DN6190_c0_g1_i3.p1 TRINITY_DN6190_c0_g1~~TRINITY_DN6190_c0_g1_i3.p1  ORF type:complete len:385 (-),score=155.17 TRINITY_DN6190_c0_g1_i3:148-1302(-)
MNKAKAMLDALMGPSRDVSAKEKSQEDWKDRTVCKKFLIGFCPYDKSCLGGRRSIDPCPKIHNEHLRKAFEEHGDGKPESQFRLQCEEIAMRDLQEVLTERDSFARKQLDQLKAETKIRRLPDEVNARISQMKREATLMKDRAGQLEDCDARQKDQLLADSETMLKDMEAYMKEEERKAQLAQPTPKTCEVCGTGYKGDEDFNLHLTYKAHSAYQEVVDFLQKLKDKKAERQAKKEEEAKKKRDEELKKEEERRAEKEKRRAEREKEKGEKKDKDKDEKKDEDGEKGDKEKGDKDGKEKGEDGKRKSKSGSREKKRGRRDRSRSRDKSKSRRRGGDRGGDGITRVTKKDIEKWDRSESRGKGRRGKEKERSRGRRDRSRSRRRR